MNIDEAKLEKKKTETPTKRATARRSKGPAAGYSPFALRMIELEIQGGRSSMLLAFAGINHLNDYLHQAALITDDCWNNVKGTGNLFANLEAIKAISGSVGSVLSTLVEGTTKAYGQQQQTARANRAASARELSALAKAAAEASE